MKREGLAASSSAQASQPSRPANPFPFSQRARTRPTSWPSTPLMLTLPSASLAAAAAAPHPLAFPVHLLHTCRATGGRQRWQERARGSRPGHGLAPPCAALTQPHATVGCDARASDHPLISIRRSPSSMAELGYKSLGPGCPRACPIAPPPPWWPSTAHPSQESRGRRGRRRGSAEAVRRRRCCRSRRRRHDAALLCAASGATRPQLATASPSHLP